MSPTPVPLHVGQMVRIKPGSHFGKLGCGQGTIVALDRTIGEHLDQTRKFWARQFGRKDLPKMIFARLLAIPPGTMHRLVPIVRIDTAVPGSKWESCPAGSEIPIEAEYLLPA